MMKINKNEQDFVLKYFQPGKLDTRKALQPQLYLYACVASAG